MQIALVTGVILLASVVASFTDWLFMNVLVHRYYLANPEIWRQGGGVRRIVLSQMIGTLATAAAVVLVLMTPGQPLVLAVIVWCAGALPLTLQQWLWMPIPRAIAASHAAGWLARLLIAVLLADAWLAPR